MDVEGGIQKRHWRLFSGASFVNAALSDQVHGWCCQHRHGHSQVHHPGAVLSAVSYFPPTFLLLQVEMIGESWRSWANSVTSCGWVAGYVTLPLLAFVVPDMRLLEVLLLLSYIPYCATFYSHTAHKHISICSRGNIPWHVSHTPLLLLLESWQQEQTYVTSRTQGLIEALRCLGCHRSRYTEN